MKVMVIDDDPFVLKLLARQLANLGMGEVVTCERADQALARLEADDPSFGLILCDLQMPGMDGVEFIRQLVRISYAGDLVLVSGESERILQTAERLSKAHKLKVLGALHKPVSIEQLLGVLNNRAEHAAAGSGASKKAYSPDDLARAISGGQLVNHYQPKVEIRSGAVVGVETLVRWVHAEDGLVYPDQFIAMAEDHGLIDDLTRAVLAAALQQTRLWLDAGLDLRVAVNISMGNLNSLAFPDFIVQSANDAGVPATNLILEITESRLMKDTLAVLDILTRLRLKHIGLSIDDFGTGHSSLAQLRDIPFDEFKVDRGFVHGAGRDASLRAIFEANLGMARQLGMKTVAEGVEDHDDWIFLRDAGCDLAQGYFIAKPMPAAELVPWIERWEAYRHELLEPRNETES